MSTSVDAPAQITLLERFAAAVAYVLGAVPALLNLDPYFNLIGPVVSRGVADAVNIAVLIGVVVMWLGFQVMERGFVRAHIAQMAVVVFLAGLVGWLTPGPQPLGTGLVPMLASVLVWLGMLVLGAFAWAGVPPSLPVVGRLSRRWGRYDRRENT